MPRSWPGARWVPMNGLSIGSSPSISWSPGATGGGSSIGPKTWVQLIANCEILVFQLARERELDELISKAWFNPDHAAFLPDSRQGYDISAIYGQLARGHERAELLIRAEVVRPGLARKEASLERMTRERAFFPATSKAVHKNNEELLDRWHELPRRVQDQVWMHLRHYLHSILGVSWLFDFATPRVSALLGLSWRKHPVSLSWKQPVGVLPLDSPTSETVGKLLDRLGAAIADLGYEAVVEDLSCPDLLGGEDSLVPSAEIMVVPGHLADTGRPILLAATKGWNGRAPRSFASIMRQVKARLIEGRGAIQVVVVFCDSWDSTSFEEHHREELGAHARNGVRFVFVLVGVPDRVVVPVPVAFDEVPQ
jgi:hypothetical protein